MELRPELMPPKFDKALVSRLARLANRLDGSRADQSEDELSEFNPLAGTTIPLKDFQGIYGAEDHEDWVRRVLNCRSLSPINDLSIPEMIEIVSRVRTCAEDHDFYLELFLINCKHPSGSDLIYWSNLVPELPQDHEPTAAEIADLAMRSHACEHTVVEEKCDDNRRCS